MLILSSSITRVEIFSIDKRNISIEERKPDNATKEYDNVMYESVVLKSDTDENVYLVKPDATGYANLTQNTVTTAFQTFKQSELDLEVCIILFIINIKGR